MIMISASSMLEWDVRMAKRMNTFPITCRPVFLNSTLLVSCLIGHAYILSIYTG